MEHVPREVLTVDVSPVIGPLFIGNILNWMLMGTLVMQLYTYYITFPTEKLFLRILVNGLFLLDVAQTVTSTHYGWFFIVTTWGNPSNFDIIPWSASMIPLLCGIVSAVVQMFYAWRIWVLASNRFLKSVSILVVVLAFTQGLAAVLSGSLALRSPTQLELIKLHPEVSLWLSTSFTVDSIITIVMTYILSQAKQNTVWSPTEAMLTTLIHRVIQTGAASAICAAVDLAMFVHFPTTNYHFAPAYILGKVYTNSLMLTLNLRRPTASGSENGTGSTGLTSFRTDDTRAAGRLAGGVHITRTLDVEASQPELWNQKDIQESNIPLEHMVHMPKKDGEQV